MAETSPALRLRQTLSVLALIALIVVCLYWGQSVLMPFVLAVLFSFLLSPVVIALERRIGRVAAVVATVGAAGVMLALVLWTVVIQLSDLAGDLPDYKENLREKIAYLRGLQDETPLEKVQQTLQDVSKELDKGKRAAPEKDDTTLAIPSIPVRVKSEDRLFGVAVLPGAMRELVRPLASLGLVIVLVFFMLLRREDLRDRFLRIASRGRLVTTTTVLGDVAQRISRFLLTQLVINGTYGATVFVGLLALGLPHPLLWGFLAAGLRYIPYVGPWVAALLPITLGIVVFPGWFQPMLVAALFVVLELLSNNVMEPLLYGRSVGISPPAVLVAAAFWAWLWGPIGLMLSTPMTVCLVVLGKYFKPLEFLYVLFGNEPPLADHVRFYQRLLSKDRAEAHALVRERLRVRSLEEMFDQLLVPALVLAKQDLREGGLARERREWVFGTLRSLLEDLGDDAGAAARAEVADHRAGRAALVLGLSAHDEADELALRMFRILLGAQQLAVRVFSPNVLCSEVIAWAAENKPRVAWIAAMPPNGLAEARYLCKRLRARFDALPILVGRWGAGEDIDEARNTLIADGATRVETSLAASQRRIQVYCSPPPAGAPRGRVVATASA